MKSFTFYEDYYNLIDSLSNNKSKKELFKTILDYMFRNQIPHLSGHNLAIFQTLKHQLDVSKNNSGRGGAPQGNCNAKKGENVNSKIIDKTTDLITDKTTDLITDKHNKTSIYNFKYIYNNINILDINNIKYIYKLIDEYLEIRKKNKYIVNETVVKRLINKLNQYAITDEEKIKIIENAINGCWKDFYELNEKEKNQTMPKWIKEETKSEKATLEEINEIEELMKEVKNDKKIL